MTGYAVLGSPAHALTRTVIDGAGREVTIPATPRRVVAIFDGAVTLPLYELGAPLVGSTRVGDPGDGSRTIHAFEELFGISSDAAGIADVGSNVGYDLERIASLGPDLIVSEQAIGGVEALSTIAPVYVLRAFSGGRFGLDALAELAHVLGAEERYAELAGRYKTRIAAVSRRLPGDPDGRTFLAIMPLDQIRTLNGAGALMQVMHDLGYRLPDWIAERGGREFSVAFSPEELPQLDADLVLLVAPFGAADQSPEAARDALSALMPGWDRFLPAAREERLVHIPGRNAIVATFSAAHEILDVIGRQL